jgi:serine/threonine protein kinase
VLPLRPPTCTDTPPFPPPPPPRPQSILHSDLKARNILLKSSPSEARGFVAKVADFGLSMEIDPHDTHVSGAFQG